MGAEQSSDIPSEELQRTNKLFSIAEKQNISQLFNNIKPFTQESFSRYINYRMPVKLVENFYKYILYVQNTHVKPGEVQEEALLITLGHMMKGTSDHHASIIMFLSNGRPVEEVMVENLKLFITSMIMSCCQCLKSTEEYKSWQGEFSDRSLQALVEYIVGTGNFTGLVDMDRFSKWLPQNAFLLKIMNFVSRCIFPVAISDKELLVNDTSRCILPMNTTDKGPKQSGLLDLPALLYINHHLPGECHSPWRLLFSTVHHGQSFTTMMRDITDKGPTVIVIKDTSGHVFGGFASQSWNPSPKFSGTSRCFLFSCQPNIAIYQATGCNENYMYFNHGQDTMPNGIGMGGQLGYFGFWLDYDFGSGHSHAKPQCTTFNSLQLSKEANFTIHTLEVWGVGPPPTKPVTEDEDEVRKSILDKDPEAKAMLTLLDKGPVSEGLREADATSDIPEEHSLPPM